MPLLHLKHPINPSRGTCSGRPRVKEGSPEGRNYCCHYFWNLVNTKYVDLSFWCPKTRKKVKTLLVCGSPHLSKRNNIRPLWKPQRPTLCHSPAGPQASLTDLLGGASRGALCMTFSLHGCNPKVCENHRKTSRSQEKQWQGLLKRSNPKHAHSCSWINVKFLDSSL